MAKQSILFEKVPGFQVSTVSIGLKQSGNPDLGLIVADKPAAAAGVFTTNRVKAAPVTLSRRHLNACGGRVRAILVNAGNANACTGEQGMKDARECARLVAKQVGAYSREVLLCSTGIIGRKLDMKKMRAGIEAVAGIRSRPGTFARAIMTTDLVLKSAGVRVKGLGDVVVAGVCKGSGMIAPNMATMLGFILTDAAVSHDALQVALREVTADTFNRVTVDGDTSTNDAVLAMASGAAGGRGISGPGGKRYRLLVDALQDVCASLAEQIAADGEGATKLVRVHVTGARSQNDARRAARTIAESPLVKTAMFGNDPNWGRVLAALGRSKAFMRERKVRLALCGEVLFEHGLPRDFDAAKISKRMRAREIRLEVDLGLSGHETEVLTCDLSYDYVRINAEYHT